LWFFELFRLIHILTWRGYEFCKILSKGKFILKQTFSRIVRLRIERGLNQAALAKELNIPQGTLSNYEQGKREIRSSTLLKIAEFFDVSVEYLIGKTDYRQSVRSFSDTLFETANKRVTKGEFYEMLDKFPPETLAALSQMLNIMGNNTT